MVSAPTVSYLLFLLGLALSGAVELLASQTTFLLPTNDRLVLTCNGYNSTSDLEDVKQIRLSYLYKDTWYTIAQVIHNWGPGGDAIYPFQQGLDIDGRTSRNIQDAYLRVAFNWTTQEEMQTYRCDMMGLGRDGSYAYEASNEVTIQERNLTSRELLEHLRKLVVELQFDFDRYKRDADSERAQLRTEIEQLQRNGTGNQTAQNLKDGLSVLETRLWQEMKAAVAAVENRTCSRIASCQHLPSESSESYNTSSPSMKPLFATPSTSAEPSEATPPPSVRPRRATPPPSVRPRRATPPP